ncbi:MAG: hypothetical protein MH472_11640, partial [Bacteroidia bacterium]|nr:hypothetical protein [Bacteroidia bacterium]
MINSINTDFFSQLKTQLPENFELIQVSENHFLAQSTQKNILFHSYLHISEAAFKLNPKSNPNTIHVFEDQWRHKPQIVLSRVLNGLGFSQKLMARKLSVEKLTRSEAATFFEENHLWGEAKAAYYYGLCLQKKIYMAASFSKSRVMTDSDIYYRSYELIRLASAKNNLVVGGFQKLLRHFIKEKNV